MIRKGCEAYLTFIIDSTPTKLTITDIRTIKDFPNIFLDELPRVAPTRVVEFEIDLLAGTTPISIAPYHMASKELVKLKPQL